ncbi:hypothetical protein RFI_11583 [Reticulomyxa filosa]|uniref:Uncharacterized protein n=1 Tax=Reticulomyxa filosa TaxID=46433 RepID=X6NHR9_RETFI|nr:hypothetical protein RFI_11583 [Reticulomyxa filosa]|eukprot:ETO25556.1 hypothetical protein RFI_11583 [Reticulomyxa filosa]
MEYEKKEGSLFPNYWYELDWSKTIEQRKNKDIDRSPIFKAAHLIQYEIDPYEDISLLTRPQYWQLLKNAQQLNSSQIISILSNVFKDHLPPNAYTLTSLNVINTNSWSCERYWYFFFFFCLFAFDDKESEYQNKFIEEMLPKILGPKWDKIRKREEHLKKWKVYRDFYDRVDHCRRLTYESGKINFDSGLRKWKNDIVKWRYLFFESKEEHLKWRSRIRTTDLTPEDLKLCRQAIVQLEQLQQLVMTRRVNISVLESLLKEVNPDVMKVFFIWLEELTEKGGNIPMGEGWSFNRYRDVHFSTRHSSSKKVPIEYFRAPRAHDKQKCVMLCRKYKKKKDFFFFFVFFHPPKILQIFLLP